MAQVDPLTNQATLDSLRIVRRRLYAVPEPELSAMSLDDQMNYGSSIHQVGLAILKLEAAKLKGVNDSFKTQETTLLQAAAKVEADSAALRDAVKMIKAISEGLLLITQVVSLLG